MQKIRLIGHDAGRDRVLTALQEIGVLQIADLTNKNEQSLLGFRSKSLDSNDIESRLADLRYVLDFMARYDKEKKGFIQGFFNLKERIRSEEIERIAREYDHRPICQQARQLDQESIELRSERALLETRRAELVPWADLAIPLEEWRSTATVAVMLGCLPKERLPELTHELQAQLSGLVITQQISEDEQSSYIYALVPTVYEELFLEICANYGWERLALSSLPPDARGLPKEILAQIERRLQEIDEHQKIRVSKAEALIAEKRKLQALYDYLHNEHLKAQSHARLLGSAYTFVLEGWVRASDFAKLEQAVHRTNDAVYLERIESDPNEVPPVALENRRLFQPAEFLVKLFGLPNQQELDPTPFVLPFFAIFFGIALTDAGYGLALILIFWVLKRRYSHKLGFQPFANLLMLGGFSAVVAGAVTGGWFGPELLLNRGLYDIPVLGHLLAFLKWLVQFPVETKEQQSQFLIAFLLFSFALGFVQVFLGNVLEFYDKVRNGRFWEGVWSECCWMIFMLGLGIVAGVGVPAMLPQELEAPGLPASWMPVGVNMALIGAFLVVFFARVESPSRFIEQVPWLCLTAGLVLWLQRPLNGVPLGEVLTVLGVIGILITAQAGQSIGSKVRSALGRVGAGLFKLYGATGILGDVLSYSRIMALGISTGLIASAINTLAGMLWQIPAVGAVLFVVFLLVGQVFSLLINSLSAFVHSARLHYVEFFTKFYESGGESFKPFMRESLYYDVQQKS
jgi:V/A-type H+-transporting ATPase subunit I